MKYFCLEYIFLSSSKETSSWILPVWLLLSSCCPVLTGKYSPLIGWDITLLISDWLTVGWLQLSNSSWSPASPHQCLSCQQHNNTNYWPAWWDHLEQCQGWQVNTGLWLVDTIQYSSLIGWHNIILISDWLTGSREGKIWQLWRQHQSQSPWSSRQSAPTHPNLLN